MVLFNTGDQVPVIPFREVVGNGFIDVPLQLDVISWKVGTIGEVTTIVTSCLELSHPFTVCDA
jgi:hypothetical protein